MNPKCHRCSKTVYPVEKLNCLDKIWHKGCFNCETCHMTLSMKTYKGYNKLPYCNTHYPTTKHTAVADTPENRRIQKNTANISSVEYHKEFQKEKGKFTAVADDPETLRIKKTQKQASDLAYQKDLIEQRGHKLEVADDPETLRIRKTQQQASDLAYQKDLIEQRGRKLDVTDDPETMRVKKTQMQASGIAYTHQQGHQRVPDQAPPAHYDPPPQQRHSIPEPEPQPQPQQVDTDIPGKKFVALYDYTAGDDDEVSFQEGDIIIEGEQIDDGWMTGTVLKTNQSGMLPSNYVEPV